MVANKRLFIGCLLSLSTFIVNAADDPTTPDLLMLAYKKAEKSYLDLEKKTALCAEQEKKNKLSKQQLIRFPLTITQWKVAVFHLSVMANTRCIGTTFLESAIAFERYFFLEKALTGVNQQPVAIVWSDQQLPIQITLDKMAVTFYDRVKRELTDELKYLRLPTDIRNILETAPEFRNPFDFMAVLDTLREQEKTTSTIR